MIRNVEIVVIESYESLKSSIHNWDFQSLGYFCFLNFRKVKFGNATWITIALYNSREYPEILVNFEYRQVGIRYSVDFSLYEPLSPDEKLVFQKKLLSDIFLKIFDFFQIDKPIAEPFIQNLNLPYEKMYYPFIKRKVHSKLKFRILIFFGLRNFEFYLEENRDGQLFTYRIFKTVADLFFFELVFKSFQVNGNVLRIIGLEKGLIEVNLDERSVYVMEDRKDLLIEALKYCGNIIYIGDSEVPWRP